MLNYLHVNVNLFVTVLNQSITHQYTIPKQCTNAPPTTQIKRAKPTERLATNCKDDGFKDTQDSHRS